MPAPVQIIGGGVIGLSTAYALRQRGVRDIRILEGRDQIATGTSFANAGMVHASLADPWNAPGVTAKIIKSIFAPSAAMAIKPSALAHLNGWGWSFLRHARPSPHWNATTQNYLLAAHSINTLKHWQAALSNSDQDKKGGLLKIYRSQQAFIAATRFNTRLAELGLKFQEITPRRAVQIEPALTSIQDQLVGALYYPHDFKLETYQFCLDLEKSLRKHGVQILTSTPVERLLTQDGRVIGAQSAQQIYRAQTTIVAAGAYSHGLLKTIGMSLPVRPVKGYSLTFDHHGGTHEASPSLPVVDDTLHAAITPFDRKIRIAGTAQIAGFNSALSDKNLRPLLDMLKHIYPQIADGLRFKQGQKWCGYRPVSADGMPYIGHTHIPGLTLNTGHGHMGLTFSAGSADILADILQGSKPDIDTHAFSPMR